MGDRIMGEREKVVSTNIDVRISWRYEPNSYQ